MGSFANTFVTVIHVLLCVFMIFVILLQPGKDAGMGAAFGGGAATSAFGGRGAVTFLSKLTAACATFFFITSLGLSFAGLHRSVVSGAAPPPVVGGADAGVAGALGNGVETEAGGAKKEDAKPDEPGPAPAPGEKPAEPPK
jgi:preprotein translocase subunit SecG